VRVTTRFRIGYVGLGAMGRALAGHLTGKHDLIVWDINPKALSDFVERGARAAKSLPDLAAQCEVVILCLPKSAHVGDALFGDTGLADALIPGTILIDQTSGDPADSKVFAAALAARGVTMIDAPVAGGVPAAIAGQITIMASGPRIAFEKILPVLRDISPKVFCCSEKVGDGQALKAINNMVNAANRMATLELVLLGRRLGLQTAEMTAALNASPGRSFITERLLPAIVEGRAATDFALSLMVKDLNQAASLGISAEVAMPISDSARGLMNVALNILPDGARLDDVVPFMEGLMKIGLQCVPSAPPAETGSGMTREAALGLVLSGLAACNRAILLENVAMAIATDLEVERFAPVIMAGSSSSAEAQSVFDAMGGRDDHDLRSIREILAILTQLAEIGAAHGVPLVMINQVRAQYLACANSAHGSDSIASLSRYYLTSVHGSAPRSFPMRSE